MVILLVSDCQTTATKLRHLLARIGYDCPVSNVLSLDAAAGAASAIQPKPDLILFVVAQDADRSQAVLRHLRDCVDSHFLAIGPADPHLILAAVHAGANDYLDDSSDLHSGLASSLNRLSASDRRRSPMGRLITIQAASGGCGRTFLATNLAVALAKLRGRCGLFDFDVRGGDVATLLNLKPRHTIADLCRSFDKLDQKMFEQSLVEHESGVFSLAASEHSDEARYVTTEGMQKILRYGKSLFEHVVVDAESFWLTEQSHLMQESDAILVLLRLELPSIRKARRALAYFDKAGLDRNKIQLVATRYGQAKEIGPVQAEDVLEAKIRHYVPDDAMTVNTCVNCGVPLLVESPRSPIARSLAAIAESLIAGPAPEAGRREAKRGTPPMSAKIRTFLDMSLRALAPKS